MIELTREEMERLPNCTTVEELQDFIRSTGNEIDTETAVKVLETMERNKKNMMAMSDDELEQVAAGYDVNDIWKAPLITLAFTYACVFYFAMKETERSINERKEEERRLREQEER